jgi:hypothetical protein
MEAKYFNYRSNSKEVNRGVLSSMSCIRFKSSGWLQTTFILSINDSIVDPKAMKNLLNAEEYLAAPVTVTDNAHINRMKIKNKHRYFQSEQ